MIDGGRYKHIASSPNYGVVVMRERDRHTSKSMQLSVLQVLYCASIVGTRVRGTWSKLALPKV